MNINHENVTLPLFFDMPAGWVTARISSLQGEAHAVEQIAFAQVLKEEQERNVGLLFRGGRMAVIVQATTRALSSLDPLI